jgi:hypothetical protein
MNNSSSMIQNNVGTEIATSNLTPAISFVRILAHVAETVLKDSDTKVSKKNARKRVNRAAHALVRTVRWLYDQTTGLSVLP